MLNELRELYRYRELVLNLVIRDLKVRYKNSVLGFFWSLLNPLVQVATITVIFKYVMDMTIDNYSAYLLCAFMPWIFFQMSALDASSSVLFHGSLVKKTYFPREVLPVSIVLSNLVHFVMAMIVFFLYVVFLHFGSGLLFGKPGTPIMITWLALPVLAIIQLMLHLGIAFFVSCANVFYEDVKYVVMVLLNLAFYAVPVIYPIEKVYYSDMIPAQYRDVILQLYMVNPLSCLLTAYRKILLPPMTGQDFPDMPLQIGYVALAALTSFVICVLGYAFFNARKWQFVERL